MATRESKKQIGVRGEDLACAELERQGLQVLERNWRCRLGDPNMLVWCTVAPCRRRDSLSRRIVPPACTSGYLSHQTRPALRWNLKKPTCASSRLSTA